MTTLLRIDASSRRDGSYSRSIGDSAEATWRRTHPEGRILRRHVADGSIPLISQDTITGFYTAPADMSPALEAATALSDTLIAELQEADTLLITVPIYNFTVPAALKAWIDQIVRIDHTFAYENGTFEGLARTRRAIVVCAYGAQGYLEGEPFAAANFLAPYLTFLLGFIGIKDVQIVSAQSTTADEDTVRASVAAAIDHAARIAA